MMAARLVARNVATWSSSIKPAPVSATRIFARNLTISRLSRKVSPKSHLPSTALRAFHKATAHLRETTEVPQHEEVSGLTETDNSGPVTKFADLKKRQLVDDALVRTLTEDMKLETMTDVQSSTIDSCLKGLDVIAQAKTGTGKTLGFLIPVAQKILAKEPRLRFPSRRQEDIDIRALIISPTRELAEQIATEARRLLKKTGIKVQTAVGGTLKRQHLRQMQYEGCHILVGTPGRLQDLLDDSYSGVQMDNLETLVLDEADRLLDDGFSRDVYRIHQSLPKKATKARQTLMFSATMGQEVMHMVDQFMEPDYEFIKTVQQNEVPTHDRVPQKVVTLNGMQNTFPALVEMIQQQREAAMAQNKTFKAIIFSNATSEAACYYQMFSNLDENRSTRVATHPFHGMRVIEMHSKLTQAARSRNSEMFRNAKEAIMFSSDVSARGMDFPNVTHVIQIGCPRDRESYIHRIGRTGRAGKEGEGWLFLNPIDEGEARYQLKGLPLKRDRSLKTSSIDMTKDSEMPAEVASILTQCIKAAQRTTLVAKSDLFRALLGTHQWFKYKEDLINAMNDMSKYGWGMARPPALSPALAAKLNLGRFPNLNTDVQADEDIMRRETAQQQMFSQDLESERWRKGRDTRGSRNAPFRGRSDRSGDRFGGRNAGRGFDQRGRGSSRNVVDPWD